MTDESRRTPRAVIWAALLHLGLIGFLFLTTLSCTAWEHVFSTLDLPAGWTPITCNKPVALKGPVIEASLVGVSSAPLPPAKTHKSVPPPPPPSKPVIQQEKPKVPPVKTLPAPVQHPDTHNQQKVTAVASKKAKLAKRKQRERRKQHMAELEAKKQQAKLNKIFQQLDQARQASQQAQKRSKLEQKKLASIKKSKAKKKAPAQPTGVKAAPKAHSGGNGSAEAAYVAAIQSAVTKAWLRPDNIPSGSVCPIHIVQIPGGQVVSVTIEPACPFDAAGRRSVKNAVLRAQPLPYKGFEKAFRSNLTLKFKVTN